MLEIRSKSKRGFWRCGRRWTPNWQPVDEGSLSPREVRVLKDEPNLVHREVETEPQEPQQPESPGPDQEQGLTDESAPAPEPQAPAEEPAPEAEPVPAPEPEAPRQPPLAEPVEELRCAAETADGRRCRNRPLEGSEYCHLHQPQAGD